MSLLYEPYPHFGYLLYIYSILRSLAGADYDGTDDPTATGYKVYNGKCFASLRRKCKRLTLAWHPDAVIRKHHPLQSDADRFWKRCHEITVGVNRITDFLDKREQCRKNANGEFMYKNHTEGDDEDDTKDAREAFSILKSNYNDEMPLILLPCK